MLGGPFSPWPSFDEDEVLAVSNVLKSNKVNYWTGRECRDFEKEFADWSGCKYAVAVTNGTVALDLAFKALRIGAGDEVIVTSRTFLASVSSVVNSGAVPIFADVDRNTQNVTADTIQAVITSNTRAIVCVHLAGWPCDMDSIMALAVEHDLYVIEDCAQAHGAKYKGLSVGSIGHIGCWSFCQDKIMTTGGEGGMMTMQDKELWKRSWSFKDHGKNWEAVYELEHPPGFRWLHDSFGTNWRMLEMQAVIGRIQLKRMPLWHETRLQYANQIWKTAKQLPGIRVPEFKCDSCDGSCSAGFCAHAAYKCYVFVESGEAMRDLIMAEISARGVPCYSGSCSEVYREKAFDKTGWRPKQRLPIAKDLGETSLMFLCHPTLTQDEIDLTCRVLRDVVIDMNVNFC
ncbi:DegT/DnrJ/EryC1/StrS aminotransferase family protein [Planktomarina sp.]|nr:DegT/DnrJ/EryC1/StrS aminotransferase family protein [Planktomarina sp.]